MPYIGKTPTVGNFQVCDAISVVNGQAAYTLQVGGVNVAPESANHMLVSLNGILQKPGSSFTISGSTMTFASNLATGDVIDFVQILGNVLDLGQPSDNTVTAAKLATTSITGQTAETSAADADTILIHDDSASALRKMTRSNFLSGVGGTNTPSFFAHLGSNQSISTGTHTTVALSTELIDTASGFDTSTYKYTIPSNQGGKYYLTAQVRRENFTPGRFNMYVLNNNSSNLMSVEVAGGSGYDAAGNSTIASLSAGDVIHLLIYHTNGNSQSIMSGKENTYFGGFKLIE